MTLNVEGLSKEERTIIKIRKAIKDINLSLCKKVEIDKNIIVYKVPTPNENKYTIRIDVKINKENAQ